MNTSDIIMRLNLIGLENGKIAAYNEAEEKSEHLQIKLLKNPDEFIKKNPSTKEITSPIFFIKSGNLNTPNPEGLLSNEIFGLTMEERSGIFGYIDLHNYFIHPLIYKKLTRLNRKFREVVHGTKTFKITPSGDLEEDPNGKTGIKWLKANFANIKLKSTDSDKRDIIIKFIENNRANMWMNKLIVLPAYYRDVNTESTGKISVGEINELYSSIIISVKGIKETEDYGIPVADSINGRIQELLLAVYDWFSGNSNDALEGATGLSKKLGMIRRSGLSKTADFGSRLILSAPELKVETVDEMIDIKHAEVPLASVCANFEPYMIYHIKKFFENEFAPGSTISVIDKKNNKVVYDRIVDPMIQFSDEVIKEQMKKYIHGYSNRLIPIEVLTENNGTKLMLFKGKHTPPESILNSEENSSEDTQKIEPLAGRPMTWCELFFIAANEVVKGKHILITRYPIDSMYNQFPCEVLVSTTLETEPMYFENTFYPKYPKIREDMIGKDTSNMFIDTLRFSNLHLKRIVGDYDGDQVSSKGVFTDEANEEISEFMDSKAYYIGLNGKCTFKTTNESIQSMYELTLVLDGTPLDEMKF